MPRLSESQRSEASPIARGTITHTPRTVPVDVLEVDVTDFAVEGAVRPADLEQGTDSPPRAGPAVGARSRHRRQGKIARVGGVTPLCHSVFVPASAERRSKESQTAGQPLKIYRPRYRIFPSSVALSPSTSSRGATPSPSGCVSGV